MIGLISTASPAAARRFQAPVAAPSASAQEFHLPSPRYELKFRINETTALAIRDYARAFVKLDPYADLTTFSYPISSLYLDSDELLTFWTTINGTRRNYKLRVRTYDDRPDSPVFFEVKRGIDDTILKERGAVRAGAVEKILAGNLPAAGDLFSADPTHRVAVENFVRLMRQIGARPKAYVRYMREAWVGRDDEEVRFTMDRDIGVSPQSTARFPTGEVTDTARPFGRMVVLEIKFNHRMPLWFRDLAAVIGLRQEPAAKYCDGLRMHGLGEFNPVDWPATNPARGAAPTLAPASPRATRASAPSLLAGLPELPRAAAPFDRPALPTALFASSRST